MSGASQPSGPGQRDENTPVTFLRSRSIDRNRQRIRILIADDHPVFRYGLRMLLRAEADLQVVGEAADGAEALKLAEELRPDILLVDLATQQASAPQVLQEIARAHPGLRTILLLTAQAEKQQIIDALRLGVRGVVMKTASPKTFVKSIRMVTEGEYWVPRGTISDFGPCPQRGPGGPSPEAEDTQSHPTGIGDCPCGCRRIYERGHRPKVFDQRRHRQTSSHEHF